MSGFAFGFSGEDIDHEEDQEFPDVVTPLEASGGEDPIPAKHHSLEGLVSNFPICLLTGSSSPGIFRFLPYSQKDVDFLFAG